MSAIPVSSPTPLPALLDDRGSAGAAELAGSIRRRGWRVLLLTIGIAAMSLVDLHITLLYVRSVGMGEGNPLARLIMTHCPPQTLVIWKLLTIVLACAIFIGARRTRTAEIGAWFCCGVMLWLTLRWMTYAEEVTALTPTLHIIAEECGKWVHVPR